MLDPVPVATFNFDGKLSVDELEAFHHNESPRSTGIVLSAILENRLTSLLQMLMVPDEPVLKELFRPTGPVGPFGTKIRLAYLLRVVEKPAYEDLNIVCKIRNRFAHDLSVKSFEDSAIKDVVKNMHSYRVFLEMVDQFTSEAAGPDCTREATLRARVAKQILSSTKESYRVTLQMLVNQFIEREEGAKAGGAYLAPWLPPLPQEP